MIRYRLKCKKRPRVRGLVCQQRRLRHAGQARPLSCPQCGTQQGVEGADGAAHRQGRQAQAAASKAADRSRAREPAKPETQRVAAHRELAAAMRKLRAEVEAKSEYVGARFSEEARKIHYEEAPARGIHGEATARRSARR